MRLIQLGMGNMGDRWIETILAYENTELVALVEPDQAKAKQKAAFYHLDTDLLYLTLEDVLGEVEADGVVCVIPPQVRLAAFQLCAEHGLPILSEKPLAASMTAAQALVDLAEESGLVFSITQDYRYTREAQTIKRILSSGRLGRVSSMVVEHYQSLNYLNYLANLPYTLLQDMSIHHFDLMRFFLEADPVNIWARSWTPPWEWAQDGGFSSVSGWFEFPDEVHVTYSASWKTNGMPTSWNGNWRIECELGVLSWRDDVISIQGERVPSQVTHLNEFGDTTILKPDHLKYERQMYLLDEFYQAYTSGITPSTIVQDNIKSLKFVYDVIAASQR